MRVAACDGRLPFEVAFDADDAFVFAWVVAKGENGGAEFDWDRMEWVERK